MLVVCILSKDRCGCNKRLTLNVTPTGRFTLYCPGCSWADVTGESMTVDRDTVGQVAMARFGGLRFDDYRAEKGFV